MMLFVSFARNLFPWFSTFSQRAKPLGTHVSTFSLLYEGQTLIPVISGVNRTRSGQVIFNDTFQQVGVYEIPFGGVGDSGCTGPTKNPSDCALTTDVQMEAISVNIHLIHLFTVVGLSTSPPRKWTSFIVKFKR